MKALVLAPHIDDETLGCGGIIQRFDAYVIAFSNCGLSDKEYFNACNQLGASYEIYDFPVREFYKDRQAILDIIIKKGIPDVVFCPASFDVHQDHQVIHNEAVRAFKNKCTILGYAHSWNVINKSDYRMKVVLSKEELDTKLKAMDCYKSQKDREYFKDRSWVVSTEKYEVIQWIF